MRSHLIAHGMRARDLDLRLGRLTLITGPMGSSKTTASDALRFLALGHVPALGKTEAATAALIRGGDLGVQFSLPDGRSMSRGLSRTGKGIKGNAVASWVSGKAKPSEHGDAILHVFGADKESAAEHLDLRGLLHASPNKRAERLENLLAATSMDPSKTLRWVAALATCRVARQTRIPASLDDAEKVASGVRVGLTDGERSALDGVVGELGDVIRERGLSGALDRAGEVRREEMMATKQGRAARTKIEDRLAGMTVPTETIATLEEARDKATAEQATIEEKVRAYQAGSKERQEAADAVEVALRVLAEVERFGDDAEQAKVDAGTCAEEAARIVIPEVPPVVMPEMGPEWDQAVEDAERLVREHALDDSVGEAPEPPGELILQDVSHLQRDVAEAEEAILAAAASPWLDVARIAEVVHALAGAGAGEASDDLRRLASENGPDPQRLRGALDQAERALLEAQEENRSAEEKHEALVRDHQAKLGRWSKAESAHAKAGEPLVQAVEDAKARRDEEARAFADRRAIETDRDAEARAAAASALKDRDELRSLARKRAETHAYYVEKVAKAEADIRAARSLLDGLTPAEEVDLEASAAAVADASMRAADCQNRINALQAADALDREMGALAGQIAAGEARLEAVKGAEYALQTLRERDMGERGRPLTNRLRAFLHAAGLSVEPYVRASKRALDFGWVVGQDGPSTEAMDVPLQAMSGGETALYMAGLAAAVIAIRAPEIGLLLLEGDELPVRMLMDACETVSDEITHTIISTRIPPPGEIREPWINLQTE